MNITIVKSFKAIFIALICCNVSFAQQKVSSVWVADNGNGTYKNPIIHADYSDPDVIRVGDDFYMIASSFNCSPGLPILHSKDLVNWKIINHAIQKQIPEEVYIKVQHGKGVWAPSMNYHNGEFYIYYPDPDFGIYMIKAKHPSKEWSKPTLVLSGKGIIDPTSFWDTDGKAYLAVAWAASRAGVNSLLTLYKMNESGTAVIDEGKHVYDGHGIDYVVEGPKLYKRNGFYYILPPAGGVKNGWQLALRSKNIYGPYERKVVLVQGNTAVNGPHQGSLVQTQTGEYWFVHFQDKKMYGRIIHLQPVRWKNDWPVIGLDKDGDGTGEPVLVYQKPNVGKTYTIETPVESDEFNSDTLGLQWQWYANKKIVWYALLKNTGYLRLFPCATDTSNNMWTVPNLLLQKFPAASFTATAKITWNIEWDEWKNKKAGLIITGNDYAYISIAKNEKGFYVTQAFCKEAALGTKEVLTVPNYIKDSTVYVRVSVKEPNAECQFSYSEDGINFKSIGQLFYAKPELWIGAKVGLFATSSANTKMGGYADVDLFRITK